MFILFRPISAIHYARTIKFIFVVEANPLRCTVETMYVCVCVVNVWCSIAWWNRSILWWNTRFYLNDNHVRTTISIRNELNYTLSDWEVRLIESLALCQSFQSNWFACVLYSRFMHGAHTWNEICNVMRSSGHIFSSFFTIHFDWTFVIVRSLLLSPNFRHVYDTLRRQKRNSL